MFCALGQLSLRRVKTGLCTIFGLDIKFHIIPANGWSKKRASKIDAWSSLQSNSVNMNGSYTHETWQVSSLIARKVLKQKCKLVKKEKKRMQQCYQWMVMSLRTWQFCMGRWQVVLRWCSIMGADMDWSLEDIRERNNCLTNDWPSSLDDYKKRNTTRNKLIEEKSLKMTVKQPSWKKRRRAWN